MPSSTPKILLKHLSSPKTLTSGEYPQKLTEKLSNFFKSKVFLLNSGRSAIYIGLKTLQVGQGDEVLLQAYTCNAVPNPILWAGATPVYVDIEENTLNMNPSDLESKITPRSKVIIVQHTFGNPARIMEILKIAEKHNLKVIEDCAHSLGAKVGDRLLGSFGDLAIISFGREKIVSSLTGGALIVNDQSLVSLVEEQIALIKPLPLNNIFKEIANYFSWRILFRKILSKNWGRSLIHYLYQFDFVNVVTSQKELFGQKPKWYPSLLPNVFAHLAFEEMDNIEDFNKRRREIAEKYFAKAEGRKVELLPPHEGVYLRIVAFHHQAKHLVEQAKLEKLAFGNWYDSVIYPESVHLSKFGYPSGSCPVAEKMATQSVNLPNYLAISSEEMDQALEFLEKFN